MNGDGNEASTFAPDARSTWKRPSIDPRASPSGLTWQARATWCAPRTAAAARTSSVSLIAVLPASASRGQAAQDLLHPLAPLDRRILPEVQFGKVLQAHLSAQHGTEMGGRGAERGLGGVVVAVQRGVEDAGVAQVWADVDARDRDHGQAGIREAFELVGERFADDLVDPERAGVAAVGTLGHLSTPRAR